MRQYLFIIFFMNNENLVLKCAKEIGKKFCLKRLRVVNTMFVFFLVPEFVYIVSVITGYT